MKIPWKCRETKFLSKRLEKWGRRHLEGHDFVRRMDRQGEVFVMVQKVFGIYEAKNGTKTDELLQT